MFFTTNFSIKLVYIFFISKNKTEGAKIPVEKLPLRSRIFQDWKERNNVKLALLENFRNKILQRATVTEH